MAESTKKPDKIDIHYIKNPSYRGVHVDGALGGLTPRKYLSINFYAERGVIPKSEEIALLPDGKPDKSKDRKISDDSKKGLIREIEFGVYLDINATIEIKNWLELKIKEYEKLFPAK